MNDRCVDLNKNC